LYPVRERQDRLAPFEQDHNHADPNPDDGRIAGYDAEPGEFSRALTRISLAGPTVESVVAADEAWALCMILIGGDRDRRCV